MITLPRIAGVVSGLAVLSCILACGATAKVRQAAARVQTANDLKQIGLAYHSFLEDKRKPPASAEELIAWAKSKPDMAEAVPVLEQARPGGKYVVFWNVKLTTLPKGMSKTVLGYEAKVPAEGGMVMTADGAVLNMSVAEFQAMDKPPQAEGK